MSSLAQRLGLGGLLQRLTSRRGDGGGSISVSVFTYFAAVT